MMITPKSLCLITVKQSCPGLLCSVTQQDDKWSQGLAPKQQGLSRCFEKVDDVIASSPSGEAVCLLAVGGCGGKTALVNT